MSSTRIVHDDDIFAHTRMTFGDHLEELRWRMWSAIKGLLLCMALSFILDGIGDSMEWEGFGIGRPALKYITSPIETKVREFYNERNARSIKKMETELQQQSQRAENLRETVDVPMKIPTKVFEETYGLKPLNPEQTEIEINVRVNAAKLDAAQKRGEIIAAYRPYLSSLGITETFMVYFKVSMLCGVILACPWIAWQFWAFVGAGMYPNEKKYVYMSIFPSVILFLLGIVVCQLLVMPNAVKALLSFNSFIDVDPDLRLNEWLSFALILPLVFGVSFQTPLVMIVFNRIGFFSWQDYARKWRIAIFGLAVFAAVITPTPDIVTMMYLFVPMFGLYCVGVFACYLLPAPFSTEDPMETQEEVAV